MKYSVSLSVSGKNYNFEGDSLLEIFGQLKPEVIKSKAILTVKKGKLSAERVLFPFEIKRLMVNPTAKILMDKRLNGMLK